MPQIVLFLPISLGYYTKLLGKLKTNFFVPITYKNTKKKGLLLFRGWSKFTG